MIKMGWGSDWKVNCKLIVLQRFCCFGWWWVSLVVVIVDLLYLWYFCSRFWSRIYGFLTIAMAIDLGCEVW